MSNRFFQSVVYQLKDSIDRTVGVLDENGTVISCSDLIKIGEKHEDVISSISATMESIVEDGFTYKPLNSRSGLEYVAFVEGDDEMAKRYIGLIAITLTNTKQYYDEKFDKNNFVKNVILDNILPGDIYIKAKELRFEVEAYRVVLLIRLSDKSDVSAYDVLHSFFPDRQKDFIININETDLVLVKEVKNFNDNKDLEKLARSIIDSISSELYIKSYIGIGTIVDNIKDLPRSFNEAQIALEVGKVFDTEKFIMTYDNLGIGRLIYQLPTTLCEMFLSEVFKKGSIESLDYETLFTIQKFFENNLNVSETSRKLFVHRNTLVYRLEKIRKLTGLDLRRFDHAIVFKVALMVKKYLTANPTKF
jgi:carbohydrate diacid regulator